MFRKNCIRFTQTGNFAKFFSFIRMCFYNRIEIISIDMIRRRTSLGQHVLRIIVWRDFSFDGFNDEYLLRNVINLKFQDWIFNSYNIFL